MIVIAIPIPVAERQRLMRIAQRSGQDETFNTAPPAQPQPAKPIPSAST